MHIRPIQDEDFYNGYMEVINTFTRNPLDITFNDFEKHLRNALNQNAIILVAVADNGQIVGTVKVLIEYKLHNNLSKMAHIEDVAVHQNYRQQHIGTNLITKALEYTTDCYKVVLSCKKELVPFYEQHHFVCSGQSLTLYNSASSSVMPSS
jgi:ribosomal protein S18 acetylase RimI-like enzyme